MSTRDKKSPPPRAKTMTPAEVDYAQQRLEWLADEVWRVATGEATPPE